LRTAAIQAKGESVVDKVELTQRYMILTRDWVSQKASTDADTTKMTVSGIYRAARLYERTTMWYTIIGVIA
jgi:hypothetical protein